MGGPVQRAEEGAGGDRGVGCVQRPGARAGRHQRPDAALVAVALGHDLRPQAAGQRVDLEVRGGPFDLVEQAHHVSDCEGAQTRRQRLAPVPPDRGQRLEHAIDRAALAEEEQLVLAAEVVIEVAGRQIGGDADVAHAGGREPALPEDAGRGPHDLDAAGVGPFRTTVRRVNHRSSLAEVAAVRRRLSVRDHLNSDTVRELRMRGEEAAPVAPDPRTGQRAVGVRNP